MITSSIPLTSVQYRHSDIAYDAGTNRFALVAEYDAGPNDGDVYSMLLDANGTPVPNTFAYVDLTFDNWRKPKVANNNLANKFMVVAERGVAPTRGVWGNTIDPASGAVGDQFQIINGGGGEKTSPDIGGDSFLAPPTYFFVVWEWAGSAADHDIAGRLLDSNGAMVGSDIFLELTDVNQSNPSVSKSNLGGEWMVVWQSSFSGTDEDIHSAKVNWDGQIAYPASALDLSSISQKNPQVSSPLFSDRYMVVYESNGSIVARLTGNDMTTLFSTTLENLGDNPFGKPRYEPAVDCDGDKFIVGYSEQYAGETADWDLYADTLCADGDQLKLAEIHRNLDYSLSRDQQPAVATAWSGGGTASGPAIFSWTHEIVLPSQLGQIEVARYNGHASCCPTDCAPLGGNGVTNVDDLLLVINQWTPAQATCLSCAADINGDLVVNVDDLLKVINGWGLCP